MKVLIVALPQKISKNQFEPLELAPMAIYLLASILMKNKHEVSIIDPCEFIQYEHKGDIEELCAQYIMKKISSKDIQLIAFSVNSFNWSNTKVIIQRIADNFPDVKIALGGLHPSIFDKHVLESSDAHIVMRGEGEKIIVNLCNALEYNMTLEGVKGITYKLNGNVLRNEDEIELTVEEMENTPYPAYELLPSSNPYTQLPVETSRGCRFSCAFCSIPHRRNWRGLSVEHVIKRVKHALQFKDNINRGTRLLFVDDCFTANGERAINAFKKLHRLYGYTEKVFIEARVTDILKNQILQNIPLQMVSSMQIGVECGYNEGLKKIRKGLTVEQLFSALEILKQYQFDKHCFLSFIIGFPWETMEMINKTLDTIELICTKYKIVCNLNWLLLLPSDLWWEKEDFNIHIEEDMFDNLLWYANSDYFFTTHPLISMEDIIQVEKRIGAMQRQGGTVAYRRRIGNEEDYIEPSACSE